MPLSLSLLGFVIVAIVIHFTGKFSSLGLWAAIAVGFPLGVVECVLIKKCDGSGAKYLRLDGVIFPYLSLGVSAAMVVF